MLMIRRYHCAVTATLILLEAAVAVGTAPPAQSDSQLATASADRDPIQGRKFRDESGAFSTFSTTGHVDLKNAFFKSFGTNGRTCQTCHQPKFGWTITPASVKEVFDDTRGRDPLFRSNDGTNSPETDQSSIQARRRASSMLLLKGLIRVGLPIPPIAEFALADVDDPYHHASSADLSLFRRPLPPANLPFLNTVMWDGRENKAGRSMHDNLASQALNATTIHAQRSVGNTLSPEVLQSIVTFETQLFMAQTYDAHAGWLDQNGGLGGPQS